jgi:hypothetical protein
MAELPTLDLHFAIRQYPPSGSLVNFQIGWPSPSDKINLERKRIQLSELAASPQSEHWPVIFGKQAVIQLSERPTRTLALPGRPESGPFLERTILPCRDVLIDDSTPRHLYLLVG